MACNERQPMVSHIFQITQSKDRASQTRRAARGDKTAIELFADPLRGGQSRLSPLSHTLSQKSGLDRRKAALLSHRRQQPVAAGPMGIPELGRGELTAPAGSEDPTGRTIAGMTAARQEMESQKKRCNAEENDPVALDSHELCFAGEIITKHRLINQPLKTSGSIT